MIMMFLGEFLTILGGTFWQIAIPIIFTLYFLLSRQVWSASLVLFFVAFSFLDASIYVADAMERALPLITNDQDTHDWWNLLLNSNLLRYDNFLGRLYYLEGVAFFLLAVYLGVDFSRKEPFTPHLLRRWILGKTVLYK